jgi:1,4-dihydroxy-6-naphthoate synthase
VSTTLRVGISTCPNDTFAFHGLLSGEVRIPGVELDFTLCDVEELNAGLFSGAYDVAKGSFAAALALSRELCVLRSGAALGFGNGPLLLSSSARDDLDGARVLGPGRWTTANLLYSLFHPRDPEPQHVVFSEIMPALEAGTADVGICIHEGRFTFEQRGLTCLEDLGQTWEQRTNTPLPLGGIFARRSLDPQLVAAVEAGIGASIDHARAHPDRALVSMRRHAQEETDAVLAQHVELYVNDQTRTLDEVGAAALAALEREARTAGLLAADQPALELFHG